MSTQSTSRLPTVAALLLAVSSLAGLPGIAAAAQPSETLGKVASPLAFPAPSEKGTLGALPSRPGDVTVPRTGESPRIPGRYIVVLEDSVKQVRRIARAQTDASGRSLGFVYRHALKGYSAKLTKGAVEALRRNPNIKYIVADRKAELASQSIPSGVERVRAPENPIADIDESDDAPVDADIAIIDTGIDHEHPDLNVYKRVNCVPSSGEDEEECVENSGTDGHGHGTHVAGTAAAIDNSEGVVGVAPSARLWSVKVFNDKGGAFSSWIMAGMDWVAAQSAIEVANMSFHCGGCNFNEAIQAMVGGGVVAVAAAGNSHTSAQFSNPAKLPDVITVSALADYDGASGESAEPLINSGEQLCEVTHSELNYGEDDVLAWFSNRGSAVDLAAPGVCIYSTLPDGKYGYNNGTSMAAPHVAGAAALMASETNPGDKEDVEDIGQQLIDEGSQNWTDRYLYDGGELTEEGWKADGIQEPLLDVGPQEAATYTTRALDVDPGSALLNGGVNPNGAASSYQFEYGTTSSYGSKAPATAKSLGSGTKDVKVSETITGLKPETTYHFRTVATGGQPASGEDKTFTTPASVITEEPAGIDAHRSKLEGKVNPIGLETSYWFEYGPTTAYGTKTPSLPQAIGSGSEYIPVSEHVTGLEPGKTYHARLVASNASGQTYYGEDRTFTTTTSAFASDGATEPFNGVSGVGIERLLLETHQVGKVSPPIDCKNGSVLDQNEEQYVEFPADAVSVGFIQVGVEGKCEAFTALGGEFTPLHMNDCQFELHPGVEISPSQYRGTFDIVCPSSSPGITMSLALESCDITYLPQTGLVATYRNLSPTAVEVILHPKNVRHIQKSRYNPNSCWTDGTFDDGAISGRWRFEAFDYEGLEIPLQIADTFGPVAVYSFNEGAGTTAYDSAGEHDGAIEGPNWAEEGKYGSALSFDGTDDLVSIADASDLDLTDSFTVEAWIKPSEELSSSQHGVLGKAHSEDISGYSLSLTETSPKPKGGVANANSFKNVTAPEAAPTGQWTHVALTSDTETLRLYVDGEEVNSAAALAVKATDRPLWLGLGPYGLGYFDGLIDEVRIYQTALSQEDIEHDRDTPIAPKPTAAYSFNEGKGSIAHDAARDHDGTIEGATWKGVLSFDGEDDLVSVADAPDLDLTGAFTLEAWLRTDEGYTAANRGVIGKGMKPGISEISGYALSLTETSAKPRGGVANANSFKNVTGDEAVPFHNATHVALTSDTQTLRLYVNGELAKTAEALAAKATDGALWIGQGPYGTGNFEGRINDVRVYNEELSQPQIETDMKNPIYWEELTTLNWPDFVQ